MYNNYLLRYLLSVNIVAYFLVNVKLFLVNSTDSFTLAGFRCTLSAVRD